MHGCFSIEGNINNYVVVKVIIKIPCAFQRWEWLLFRPGNTVLLATFSTSPQRREESAPITGQNYW